MVSGYVLTEDALADFDRLEEYVLSYADEDYLEGVEDEFLEAFDRLPGEALRHPVYQFEPSVETLHEYRSVSVYRYKVFYYLRGDEVVIYRILHLASDFTRREW